jgi:SAM-dependent methyltransferase
LLDVGCGPGFLLAQARAFQAVGIEPDANVTVAANTSADVRRGYFPAALAPDEQFDAIVFNDVLEHIPDMRQALIASQRHLSGDGVLVLNCPSRHGLFYRVASALERLGVRGAYERLWQMGLPSPHIWYMTPRDLTRAAARVGLVEVHQERLDTTDTRGLWSRIRSVRSEGLLLSVAAYAFTRIAHPFSRAFPSDAVAVFYRKAGA